MIDDVGLVAAHHGEPALYGARLLVDADEEHQIDAGTIGFRELESRGELERDGLALAVNGVPVFARGAVWTPVDPALPGSPGAELERALRMVAGAGMNMLRVPGIGCYESDAFYDVCDQLGILVWQDFMFANLDYPESDEQFMEGVRREATQVLGALGRRPSLAVLCGGSEVAQQVAMLGLDPELANGPLYGELLPSLVSRRASTRHTCRRRRGWRSSVPPRRGVANYYGVGAYRRPLTDARRADVRFAAECLAFSNVPDEEALEPLAAPLQAPCTTRAGRRGCRAMQARVGTSTTFATTICACCTASIRWRCEHRPRAVPGAVAHRHR